MQDWNKVHLVVRPTYVGVGGVLDYSDDLKVWGGDWAGPSEVMADGILAGFDELFDEEVIDDGHGGSGWGVLDADSASHDDTGAYGVEVFGADHDVRCAVVRVWLALNLNAVAPIVVFHGGVGAEADVFDPGDGVEACFDGAVERLKLHAAIRN